MEIKPLNLEDKSQLFVFDGPSSSIRSANNKIKTLSVEQGVTLNADDVKVILREFSNEGNQMLEVDLQDNENGGIWQQGRTFRLGVYQETL